MKNSILFLSCKGETLSVVNRLQKEGIPASIYLHDLSYGGSYKNILPRTGLDDLVVAIKRAEVIVVDTIVKNKKSYRDLALLDKFNISHNVPDVYGRLVDLLRSPKWDKLVIGPGEEMGQYELDRSKGFDLAKKAGFSIPPYKEFKSLKEAARFLASAAGQAKEKWYIKCDDNAANDMTQDGTPAQLIDLLTTKFPKRLGRDNVDCILQEAVEGEVVELSRELWKDPDGKCVVPNSTLENKRLHSRDSGPRVGCAVSTVWLDHDAKGIIHKQVQAALKLLTGHVGCLDANCIITKELVAWFLEWSCRFGYSALYLLLRLIMKGKLGNFILDPFKTLWQDGFVASQVLSLYPFPPTTNNRRDFLEMIQGNLISHRFDDSDMWWNDVYEDAQGNLRVGGVDGLIGIATGHAITAEGAIAKAYNKVKSIQIAGNQQYWPLNEHLESHLGRLKKLHAWGIM